MGQFTHSNGIDASECIVDTAQVNNGIVGDGGHIFEVVTAIANRFRQRFSIYPCLKLEPMLKDAANSDSKDFDARRLPYTISSRCHNPGFRIRIGFYNWLSS